MHEFYIDNKLYTQVQEKIKKALTSKDEDYLVVIDGGEREGKSVFGAQLATAVDPTFNLSRMCFTPDEFRKAILEANHGQAVIFDEAYRGLSAKGALTEVNKILVSLMMEMGQKNLFIIVILPTFYLLEKYVALWRAKGLFHVHKDRHGRKGFWVFFNKKKKKLLYLKGKKDYGYNYVKSHFRGRFTNYYTLNEAEYREKKRISLEKGYRITRNEAFKQQRDVLIRAIKKELGYNLQGMAQFMKLYGIKLKKTQLDEIIRQGRAQEEGQATPNPPPTP